ncbi:MAG: heavy-metal-associated domain-containing protein [Calothrix sp. SM1_7_51]|nr:heavy-metal-associated domain-containing protein [Calothrix sp. SM1_7_51]
MTLQFKVPDMACNACAETISETIHTMEPDARIEIDFKYKIVTIESSASSESIKQAIIAAGFTIED